MSEVKRFVVDMQGRGEECVFASDYDALRAEVESLKSAWQVETMQRKDAVIERQEKENDRLRAEVESLRAQTAKQSAPTSQKPIGDTICACGDIYPDDSWDAGFIDGRGVCCNCDAAESAGRTEADELVVWRVHLPNGEQCNFGSESLARAWAPSSGSVERVQLKTLPELELVQPDHIPDDGKMVVPHGYKLVPFEVTPEMVDAAEEMHMPFGDMKAAILAAIHAAPDHVADAGKMIEQEKMDQERAAFEAAMTSLGKNPGEWRMFSYANPFCQSAWEAWQARASLPVGVPDGYALVPVEPTPEMVSAAEAAHMPFGDMDIALRMAILSAPAAEQSAPGEVEEVEVVAFLMEPDMYDPYVSLSRDSRCDHVEPLMTVAQHKRLMAAEIQKRFDGNEQSSRDHREELAQLAAELEQMTTQWKWSQERASAWDAVVEKLQSINPAMMQGTGRTGLECAIAQIDQLAARDAGEVRVPVEFVRFLLGITELRDCAFGEKPAGETGNFWWRKDLRALLAQRERGGE